MTRIKSMSSLRMVLFFLILSVGAAASAMPYWERWLVTGTTFILAGTTPVRWTGNSCGLLHTSSTSLFFGLFLWDIPVLVSLLNS